MIVDNIAILCRENNITICELERKVGIGNGVIARWRESSPKLSNAQRVAEYFGVTVDYLLNERPADSA